ncbi:MAG: [FeFe] hydrogenase H-cluster radical SAM maturase HydE [Clostridiales bacterium]|nr:[FeFe] hydrogenase H-cluster radical SAM maturase HydE [Clostridiales bacterium]
MKEIREKIRELELHQFPNDGKEYGELIQALSMKEAVREREYLFERARTIRQENFGKQVFIRGLIEISNICKNDCYYCGIRKSNCRVSRYRLTLEEVLACCREGYKKGFRTFVIQGGEDPEMTDDGITEMVETIHKNFPHCAITLSLGEMERESYQRFFEAGASRYLLRHETADERHYRRLHPPALSLQHRMKCLEELKEIGYQVGCGCMIGSPFQTPENLGQDLVYMKKFQPHMVGIGPFISQKDTPFKDFPNGTLTQTLVMLGMIRLLLPKTLLPATTALGTIDPHGREMGILAGANVVMPNLSPAANRKKYLLYDNKLGTGEESGEGLELLKQQMRDIGYEVVVSRGDYPGLGEG